MEKHETFTYELDGNLYINLTSKCTNDCTFCVRNEHASYFGHKLWLSREPSPQEVLDRIPQDISRYKEYVFCGFGEPSYRLPDICWVIDQLKAKGKKIFTRMDTNGTASLIHGRDTAPDFAGRFDMVSISLNTDTAEKYNALCHPIYPDAYEAMKAFAKEVRQYVPQVMMTVVDTIPKEEIENCRKICEEEIGATYRVREYIKD